MDAPYSMRSEVYAYSALRGADLDPDQITSLTGLTPSDGWRPGDVVSARTGRRRAEGGWRIASQVPRHLPLHEHVQEVFRRLLPGWNALIELTTRYEAELSCDVRSFGRTADS
jgi:hypothetical protein